MPATLEEALALAAQFEQDDIALYSGLLEDKTLPQGAVQAFRQLKQASERHLNALQKVGASGNPQGGIPGNGRMNGGMFSDDESFPGSAFRQPRGGRGFRRDGSFMQRMMPVPVKTAPGDRSAINRNRPGRPGRFSCLFR